MAASKISKYLFRKWLILPYLALVTFILTEILAANPSLTEQLYGKRIYPVIAEIFSRISVLLPFSLDDIFYVLLFLSLAVLIVLLIVKRISLKTSGKYVLNVLAAVYVLFYFLWGFNYYRPGLNQRLNIEIQQPDTEEFLTVLKELVDRTNKSYTSFDDFDKKKTALLVEQSYEKLAPALQLDYPSGIRHAKNITFSRFFAQAGISGYYGPFFSEVHVNSFNLPVEFPFVLAHEKAHQFGITGEAEANFYAWLVCSQSKSKRLRYSANLIILRYFIYQGYQLEEFEEIISNLDERVKNDLRQIREHWLALRNEKIDRMAAKVNDAYLKTNKVEKGIEDYHGVVKHVMDFQLDTAFQKRWNLNSE
ncbi:MAG: DUF3810 domain-containing protein [Prolixibacteraceae bacterium]